MSEKHPDSNEVLLARIDERTKRLEEDFIDFKEKLSSKYVTKDEFYPIKAICYSVVSIVGLAVLGALISLILK